MDVNSDEVIYTMMITSLEDKIKSIKNVIDIQKELINKIMAQYQNNTEELIKYKEKYGEL
jgi:iron uptake system EfeUOB component EfeO/EfeM